MCSCLVAGGLDDGGLYGMQLMAQAGPFDVVHSLEAQTALRAVRRTVQVRARLHHLLPHIQTCAVPVSTLCTRHHLHLFACTLLRRPRIELLPPQGPT
jgi:hypothetical protein